MERVLVAGHVNWDVTLRVDHLPVPDGESTIHGERTGPGGSAANVAAALSQLGVDVALYGSVGDDAPGDRIVDALESVGVDCTGVHTVAGCETSRKYLIVDDAGAVSVLGNDGANEALGPSAVDDEAVRRADHVHLTSQRPETARAFASVARRWNRPVSVDPGRRLGDRSYEGTIERADILFLSGREADAIRRRGTEVPADGERTVVVTEGGDGAVQYGPDGSVRHAGFDVSPVDTSGAGDAFAAGYLAERARAPTPRALLRFANACGAIAATTDGTQIELSRDRVAAVGGQLDERTDGTGDERTAGPCDHGAGDRSGAHRTGDTDAERPVDFDTDRTSCIDDERQGDVSFDGGIRDQPR
ncbi:carbohydrate kinase family protein [Halovivax limisalsi]|uniref:carbohydrate kinase family protein n=1 Tax=Halovivax limisalsi TaxID=1453760 RepID=UPI0031B8140D